MTADESLTALKELLLSKLAAIEALIIANDVVYSERDSARRTAVEAALKAAQNGIDAAFASSEKSTGKAEINADKWRENANEWRAAMLDRENKFASRAETTNEFRSLRAEIQSLKESRAAGGGALALWGYLVAAAALIYAFFKKS